MQSCCPAREVVELKVGAQVMLLKVRKNKGKPDAECLKCVRILYGLFTLLLEHRIVVPAIRGIPIYDNEPLQIRLFHRAFQLRKHHTIYLVPFSPHFSSINTAVQSRGVFTLTIADEYETYVFTEMDH